MNSRLKRILVFLRLIDPFDENLSFTNITLIVVITKLALVQSTSVADFGALALALSNFNIKKLINNQFTSALQDKADAITKSIKETE